MKMEIGDYLIKRLQEFNIDSIYGVPGDYNLGFLDMIDDTDGVKWVGNCNELNASYAADGYARVRGMSAIVSTFGVGELSLINGIAGSFAENVPVVNIVGMPTSSVIENGKFVHHTLGDGNFDRFYNMFTDITISKTILDEMSAQTEIDRVLRDCYIYKKPVYIGLPIDIVNSEIEVYDIPLNLEVSSNKENLDEFINDLRSLVNESRGQMILADYEVLRAGLKEDLTHFVNEAKIPVSTLSLGKTAIDETNEYFAGIYTGRLSSHNLQEIICHSDLMLLIGVKFTDSTTAGFNFINPSIKRVEINAHNCKIGEKLYTNLYMKDVLNEIEKCIEFKNSYRVKREKREEFIATDNNIVQDRFFKQIESFLKEDDMLIAEQGTSFFGASEINMPKGSSFIGQPLWGSIGYTLPATLGSQMADKNRRNILLIGDGSFQLTAQEISTILREEIKPVIFMINNDGYTIERAIHGRRRGYNDINMWDYTNVVKGFGLRNKEGLYLSVRTEKELEKAMQDINENKDKFAFIEVHMNKDDAPKLLKDLGNLIAKQNKY